jgi:gamma-glutamylcyclotransferase (GGCT)/AIG2-like uncharacterized protein YtfP
MQVFVYGTLKQNFRNHYWMIKASGKFIDKTICKGFACINTPCFPYAIKKEDAQIIGELYEVPQEKLRVLDQLEGYPDFYIRTIIDTPLGEAWIYYSTDNHTANIAEFGFTEEWVKK